MKKSFLFLSLFFCKIFFAQVTYPSKYWIQFKDKTGTPYTVGSPSAFLSQRAIDRRIKQSITIKENDLPVNPSYINAVKAIGDTLLNISRWFNAITILTHDTNKINLIKSLSCVKGSKPVGMIKGKFNETTIPLPYLKTEHVNGSHELDYGQATTQISMIGGICLHDSGYHGEGMQIAVIDAGFINVDTHPAFDSLNLNGRILGRYNFLVQDTNVYKDDVHGTEVLSTMAGNLPGQLVGTAPAASYYLLISENGNGEYIIEEDNWVSAAEYADSAGADVINTSLGYNQFSDRSQNHTYADLNGNTAPITVAADLAVSKGMIVVCSAGNEGDSPWRYVDTPADGDSVLAVGAVDVNGIRADFSSVGPTSDGRIKPDVVALGWPAEVADAYGVGIIGQSGTSFASPTLAGMVTCLWQANPTKRNTEITDAVKQSASQYNNPDNLIGYGIPNFCIADALLKGVDPKVFQEDDLVSLPMLFDNSIEGVFYSAKSQTLHFELFDLAGKLILREDKKMMGNNYNNFKLEKIGFLAAGFYFLTITGDERGYKYRMFKQ